MDNELEFCRCRIGRLEQFLHESDMIDLVLDLFRQFFFEHVAMYSDGVFHALNHIGRVGVVIHLPVQHSEWFKQ